MGKRKTIGEIAAEYMRENGYTFVMHGDSHLLHEIAEAAGLPHRSWRTEEQVLNALDGSKAFVKTYVRLHRLLRCFHLPEHAPK